MVDEVALQRVHRRARGAAHVKWINFINSFPLARCKICISQTAGLRITVSCHYKDKEKITSIQYFACPDAVVT